MMYASLARVYDRFAYDFDYEAWADVYERLISRPNPVREICDCGCGTGSVAIPLARRGYALTGVDISADMLEVAAEKARAQGRSIRFIRQDMRQLALTHAVDAVIAPCDGVNYLTRESGVSAFFERAYACLRSPGVLAFDISNEEKLLGLAKTGLYAEELDDMAYIWQNTFDMEKRLLKMQLTFFVKDASGLYERFEETHTQKAHKTDEIAALLEKAGFTDIQTFGSDTGEDGLLHQRRVFFCAIKP